MSAHPSGTAVDLATGQTRASVTTVGASLRDLTVGGRPLVVPFAVDEVRPEHRGAVLVPWPGRVADGRYTFDGAEYQLDISEPARGHALHGLVAWTPFDVVDQSASALTLATWMPARAGYPWSLAVTVRYELRAGGLTWTVTATNGSDRPAPIGLSVHPYLLAGTGDVDGWTINVPAADRLVADDRLVPTGEIVSVGGSPLDLRRPSSVADLRVDDTFDALVADEDGRVEVRLLDRGGDGVAVSWRLDEAPWVQLYATDLDESAPATRTVAVEPMTIPPNAFASGDGLRVVAPAESTSLTVDLDAVIN